MVLAAVLDLDHPVLVAAAFADHAAFAEAMALCRELDFGFLRDDVHVLLIECRNGIERVRKIVVDPKGYSHGGDWQWADLDEGLNLALDIARNAR